MERCKKESILFIKILDILSIIVEIGEKLRRKEEKRLEDQNISP